MNTKFFLLFAILLTLIGGVASHVNGQQDKEKAKQELLQLKKDIESLQSNLKSKRQQQSKAITQLKQSEKQIATTSKILRSTIRQLTAKDAQLKNLKQQQVNLGQSKLKQKVALAAQIRSSFINGRQEYLKMLLNQQDPEALGRMLIYYDYMNQARVKKVAKLQQTLVDLANIDSTIRTEIDELNVLKISKENETQRLTQLKNQRQQLVNALTKEINSKADKLTELQINAKELQDLIDSVREAIERIDFTQPLEGLKPFKGKLRWPTRGTKIQNYNSTLTEGLRSNGVIIAANEGEPVNVIHYGRVVYADWLRGFGLLTIIDHGKGYMSLYGYNQALYKQVGDWVEAGEAIATVGQSGGKQESGLYFELRHQGKPFNPKYWIK